MVTNINTKNTNPSSLHSEHNKQIYDVENPDPG